MSELDLQVWKLNSLLEELGLSRGLLDLLLSSPGMLLSVSRSDSSVSESCWILCDELGTWNSDLSSSYSSEVVAVSPGGALGWWRVWPVLMASVFSLALLWVSSSASLASSVGPCSRFCSFLRVQFCSSRSLVLVVFSFLVLLGTISLANLARWACSGCQLCSVLGVWLGSLVTLILS